MRFPTVNSLLSATIGGLVSAGAVLALQPAAPASVPLGEARAAPAARASFAAYAEAPDDFRRAARRSMDGVVNISTREERAPSLFDLYAGRGSQVLDGTGSGVLYRADGYIVTNNHVIDGAQELTVTLDDNRRFRAEVVGTYPPADLAVLHVDGNDLPALTFADSDEVEVGDWVLAVGNPYELSSTVTAGIVSARGRDIDIINSRDALESFIQTDAAINPGNSGGALVNADGDVVGINTAIYSRSGGYTGYGFAIPANLTARIVDEIIATGSFRKVSIGIDAVELDEEYARELGVGVTQGVVIEGLFAGGPAEQSGLQVGDIVIATSGRTLRSIAEFREAVGSRRPGEGLTLTVLRDGGKVEVVLQL